MSNLSAPERQHDGTMLCTVLNGPSLPFAPPGWQVRYREPDVAGIDPECINGPTVCETEDGALYVGALEQGNRPDFFDIVGWEFREAERRFVQQVHLNQRLRWAVPPLALWRPAA